MKRYKAVLRSVSTGLTDFQIGSIIRIEEDPEGEYVTYESAMTEIRHMKSVSLRDYFAGQALSGFRNLSEGTIPYATIAAEVYEMAEAMLKRRQHEMVLDTMDQMDQEAQITTPSQATATLNKEP